MLMVQRMVYVPSACYLNHGYIAIRHNLPEDINVGDDRGAHLVATCLHYPLIEPLVRAPPSVMSPPPGGRAALFQSAYVPILVYTQQDSSTPSIGKRDHVLHEFVTVNHAAIEFDAGILAA